MESSSKMKYKIPFEDVYKIHLLNKEGNISSIYIFCANQYEKSQLSDLFSDLELAYFEAHDVELVFSPLLIHKDDTIRNMKRKIIQEMESHASEKKEDFSCSLIYSLKLLRKSEIWHCQGRKLRCLCRLLVVNN